MISAWIEYRVDGDDVRVAQDFFKRATKADTIHLDLLEERIVHQYLHTHAPNHLSLLPGDTTETDLAKHLIRQTVYDMAFSLSVGAGPSPGHEIQQVLFQR